MKPSTTNAEHPRCTICSYIRDHPDCGINQMLVDGVGPTEVARRFPELKAKAMAQHNGVWNHGHDGVPHYVDEVKKTRRKKEALELNAIMKKIIDMSIMAGEFALSENDPSKRDLKAFGPCMAPACKMAELLYDKTIAAELQKQIDELKDTMAKQ